MAAFERSPLTDSVVEALRNCPPGEIIYWKDLVRLTNRELRKVHYNAREARNIVLRDYGIAFRTIVTVGLQRLSVGDHAGEGKKKIRHVAKTARVGRSILNTADVSALRGEAALAHGAIATVLSSIETAANVKMKRIPPSTGGNKDPVMPDSS